MSNNNGQKLAGKVAVSRLPMKRLGAPDEIAETIVFTGPID
jgi:NAD(P)-dependent dehydrogenase (short-subunit alcohol dehydrogenase family)